MKSLIYFYLQISWLFVDQFSKFEDLVDLKLLQNIVQIYILICNIVFIKLAAGIGETFLIPARC